MRWATADDVLEVRDRDELVEWRRKLGLVDALAADPDPLEDGLVEESSGRGRGGRIGGLEVVGQLQGDVEPGEDVAVVDVEFGLELLGRGALALDALLLFVEQALGDAVGVVGGEQFALVGVEPTQQFDDASAFGSCVLIELLDVGRDASTDVVATPAGQLDGGIVVLDRAFDGLDAVVGLAAAGLLASGADDVLVDAAVAVGAGVDQPSVAFGAVEAAAQVAVVSPVALAALALRVEGVLDGLERRSVDERLVAALVDLAGIAQRPDVVVVAQERSEAVGAERSAGRAATALAAQAAGFEDGAKFGERVVAGGVEPERLSDQLAAFGIDGDAADLAAVDDLADVGVADRRAERGAAALGLLGGSLLDFESEVPAVELGDRAHDAVE